jgi:phage shock protein A
MSLFKKIMTAVRGGASEVGEAIVDSNSLRIYEQEIRDSEERLVKAKRDLTGVMAVELAGARTVSSLKASITEHEGYAVTALDKGDEALALQVAEKIGSLESELASEEEMHNNQKSSAAKLKEMVKKTEREIVEHKRQLQMVKTTESVQKATEAATSHLSSGTSGLSSAKSSLERIKARQQKSQDQYEAAEQLENGSDDLASKLKEAGITGNQSSASSILDRLKKK